MRSALLESSLHDQEAQRTRRLDRPRAALSPIIISAWTSFLQLPIVVTEAHHEHDRPT